MPAGNETPKVRAGELLWIIAGLFVFTTTLFIAAASPGPGIAAIVARVLGRGTTGAVAFTAGVAIGRRGLADLRDRRLGGAGQRLSRGVPGDQMGGCRVPALHGMETLDGPGRRWRRSRSTRHRSIPSSSSSAGLAVTMGNPKVMVFYLALLPTLLDLSALTWLGYAELVAAILAVLTVGFWRLYPAGGAGAAAVHQRKSHPGA